MQLKTIMMMTNKFIYMSDFMSLIRILLLTLLRLTKFQPFTLKFLKLQIFKGF